MDNWDDFRFLVALSKAGTMTAAAKMLGTNTATVSRRIDRLSETLGTPAFVKTADGWKPSEAVREIISIANTFDGELRSAMNTNSQDKTNQLVSLNVGSVPIVTSQVLFPGLRRHGDMLDGVSLTFSDRIFREGLGENDLVIMYGAPESGRVVTRRVGQLTFRLYGWKGGKPTGEWVGLAQEHDEYPPMQMAFDTFKCPPRMRVESFTALYDLMLQTKLPGPLPDTLAAQDSELVTIKTAHEPFRGEFWMMFHESRRGDPAMRKVVDWVTRSFQDVDFDRVQQSRAG
ncbi:LysR family transcriptional regulator [Litorisediminicola beolgyonensis]|uniref:LysR family transcriptional regulator n=1 Tax=Litorisediminicola beolgyonensis TaxID=1173614 RepID=A0ABW3ZEZ3_9RHOB